ncbi:MAG: hypothetical protein HC897_08825 [Thermoanaerobaculia bacterium]|nr:hypothetical protein [Thermoanaerobaculia bacterium]
MLVACVRTFLILLVLSGPLVLSPTATAQDGRQVLARGAEVYGPVTPIKTQALRDLAQAREWAPGDPIREVPRRFYPVPGGEPKPSGEGLPDPLLDLLPDLRTPTLVVDVNTAGTGFTGATPPDTVGDVGPSHYVQAVNATRIAIFDKTGTLLPGYPITLSTLAPSGACRTNAAGDPIVLYDRLADRWFLQEFTGGGLLCIYISQTPDPTGAYYFYSFSPPSFPDYPHFGVWPDAYYGSTNENGSGGNQTTYAFDRLNMLAGNPATMQRLAVVPPVSGYGFQTLTPVDHDGASSPPAGAPGLFMRHFDDEAHTGSPNAATDLLQMWAMDVDWTTPANTTVTALPAITITDFNSWMVNYSTFFSVPQPGTTTRLDPIREAILNRLSYLNFTTHETLVGALATNRNPATSGSTVSAGLRWFELRRTGGPGNPWTLHQEGTFGGDANSATAQYFMGAIAMDGAGNIGLGYSKTDTAAPNVFPSLGVAARLATDAPGTMGNENSLASGVQAQTGTGRWGDYAALGVDPEDDCTFWFTSEFMPGGSWGTRVASFTLQECLFGFLLSAAPASVDVCAATDPDPQFTLDVTSVGGWSDTVTLSASGLPPSTTPSFSTNGSLPDFTSTFTVNNIGSSTSGSYPITITGTGSDMPPTVRGTQVTVNLALVDPDQATLTSPADAATGISLAPTFTWNAAANAASYALEIATDAAFTNVVYTASGLTTTSHTPSTPLQPSTEYFWRVTTENICGQMVSASRSFTTVLLTCQTFISTNVPLPIPQGAGTSGTTVSTLSVGVASGGTIADVNVLDLVGTHTWFNDLDFKVTSPQATTIEVISRSCGNVDNFNLNLDDEAAPGPWPCPPTDGGTYQPSTRSRASSAKTAPAPGR